MAYATEGVLEKKFKAWCDDNDIICIKGPSMFAKGFPDRFAQLPNGGGSIHVEFKGTSYYGLTKMQQWWQRYLVNSDPHRYFVVADTIELDNLIQSCKDLIAIGKKVVAYETKLLKELNSGAIINHKGV